MADQGNETGNEMKPEGISGTEAGTDSKKVLTPEEELQKLKGDRKFYIGFFITVLVLTAVYIILRITGKLEAFDLIRGWYSCEGSENYFIGSGVTSLGELIYMVIFYLVAPVFFLCTIVTGLFYAPYAAFRKIPKEIEILEMRIRFREEEQESEADPQSGTQPKKGEDEHDH